ncbi:MAG: hypothetical protein IKX48_06815 [Victivallales bacterium]|nr:hypothetical protein [Victivallales bacterium]MBR5024761.1 hypothetical protein [Victivallales bacterium]
MKLPESDILKCEHIGDSPKDMDDMDTFEVHHRETGKGLELYFKRYALQDEYNDLMRTYVVRHKVTDECVGYFSLKAGLIAINEKKESGNISFDTLPGVELANFAINKTFAEKYNSHGLGKVLFLDLIAPFVTQLSEYLGIYMLYLFALPYKKLMSTYESYGFKRLPSLAEQELHKRIKPAYDQSCIFMYQTLRDLEN